MKPRMMALGLIALACIVGQAWAQPNPDTSQFVSRAEYNKLQQEFRQFKSEMVKLKRQRQSGMSEEYREQLEFVSKEIERLSENWEKIRSGSSNFLVTGYAFAGYTDAIRDNASFNAGFNPIFLWTLSDNLSFAGEIEFELDASSTTTNLEFLEMDWDINDYLTLRMGKFLTPLSTFKEQLHAPWINKLPNQPLFAGGGTRLIPTSSVGFELSGAAPLSETSKINYAFWMSNGPKLNTTGSNTGQLNFSNFSDVNDAKDVGVRIGWFIIPELEVAYGVLWGEVGPDTAGVDTFDNIHSVIHDLSISLVSDSDKLGGKLDIRFEYIWSQVDTVAYTGVTLPDNDRQGGYAQIAYRPTKQRGFWKDVEFVFRWDFIENPASALNGADTTKAYDEDRYAFGINYWLNPSTVLKVAYQIDNVRDPQNIQQDADTLMMQMAMGF